MTKSKSTKPARPKDAVTVVQQEGESEGETLARVLLNPYLRHGHTVSVFAGPLLGKSGKQPDLMDYAKIVKDEALKAEEGQLGSASRFLAAQAMTLDGMFTEFARRAALNMGEYVGATVSYGRLALKAQSNCRATLEALAKLHQPREQTVRHVHVNDGGQAVVADQIHHHTGVAGNAKPNEQPHATGTAGEGAALPRPDPLGSGVPVPGRQGAETMPNARRDELRGS
jgi:hypothetical protein